MATTVLERDNLEAQRVEAAAPREPATTSAQAAWAATPIATRLRLLRQARHQLANASEALVDAISLHLARTRADSYAAEVLPLLSACRFLEQQAATILRPRRLGRKGLPFWLAGIDSTVERVPLGRVLLIAPSNYPLFLAGVQALQALAAGNTVVWKPGRDGRAVAEVFAQALTQAGLPSGVLRVTDESIDTAIREVEARPDKIIFTGSSAAGRAILHLAADLAIPVIAELSGCDAVVALPSANPALLVDALAFGMRLNGSATCMAPRRLFLVGPAARHEALLSALQSRFAAMDAVEVPATTRQHLREGVAEAEAQGATVLGNADASTLKPVLVLDGSATMRIAQSDVFAPVLTIIRVDHVQGMEAQDRLCPFGLTAAIFGEETAARELGKMLNVGTVLINDLIVPTADPRVPFGGRRGSGFGTTRGAEGLLEMTSAKVTQVRKQGSSRHLQPTGPDHEELFRGVVAMNHSQTFSQRFNGLRRMIAAATRLK
jgi:acyl-CoA reductase-like NAD-dependent aldehyde dehydrogenase